MPDLGEGSGGSGNGSPTPGRPQPSSLDVLKSEELRAAAAVSTHAKAACDTSGARAGFCRRRGRAADATADRARCTHLAMPTYASACTTSQ